MLFRSDGIVKLGGAWVFLIHCERRVQVLDDWASLNVVTLDGLRNCGLLEATLGIETPWTQVPIVDIALLVLLWRMLSCTMRQCAWGGLFAAELP